MPNEPRWESCIPNFDVSATGCRIRNSLAGRIAPNGGFATASGKCQLTSALIEAGNVSIFYNIYRYLKVRNFN